MTGGLEGLQARLVYPELAVRGEIEGRVIVQFVVDTDGRVTDPIVLRSPNDLLTAAAIEAVMESRFTPGMQRGRPVRVRYTVPIRYALR